MNSNVCLSGWGDYDHASRSVDSRRGSVAMPGVGRLLAAVPRASRPLDILVLGGTGFFGPHQVEYALARGLHLTLFNRGNKDAATIYGNRVEVLIGDRDVKTSPGLAALEGTRHWDAVIDKLSSVLAI
jgi:2'-hydroxyisoflavone reductase